MRLSRWLRLPSSLVAIVIRLAGAEHVLPLQPYVAGLRTLEVSVDGRAGRFIFDTGGGLSLATPAFCRDLGVEPFGRIVGFRHNGEPAFFQRAKVREVTVAGMNCSVSELAVFDLMKLLEGAPPIEGIVALDLFAGKAVTIDFAAGHVYLEDETTLAQRAREMLPLRVRIARQSGGAALDVFVGIEAPQGVLWFELDSGNAGPVFVSPSAAEMLRIAGESAPVTLVCSKDFSFTTPVQRKEMIYDGLLNTAFFREHIITLDLAHSLAWVKKQASASTRP
jgi:hypothetical protein